MGWAGRRRGGSCQWWRCCCWGGGRWGVGGLEGGGAVCARGVCHGGGLKGAVLAPWTEVGGAGQPSATTGFRPVVVDMSQGRLRLVVVGMDCSHCTCPGPFGTLLLFPQLARAQQRSPSRNADTNLSLSLPRLLASGPTATHPRPTHRPEPPALHQTHIRQPQSQRKLPAASCQLPAIAKRRLQRPPLHKHG